MIVMNDALYDYVDSVSNPEAAVLAELRVATEKATPWFRMQIPALQGQFMQVLIQISQAKRVLEVGTFTGYSALAMAMVMPADGRVVTCDISDEYTSLAREFWAKAGMADKIELRLGPGIESLDQLLAEDGAGTYDFAFIDADKANYWDYWDQALVLLRPGGLIIADNTLFQGTLTDDFDEARLFAMWRARGRPEAHIPELVGNTHHARVFNVRVSDDDRVTLSVLPVADGMTLGVKK